MERDRVGYLWPNQSEKVKQKAARLAAALRSSDPVEQTVPSWEGKAKKRPPLRYDQCARCKETGHWRNECPHLHGHARPPCPSPTPGVYSNSCPSSWWCHPTISSSVIPFSSRLQSFPALGSFPLTQLFTSSGQSIGVSASTSVLPVNTQDWFPLGWTGWISLQSKGLSRVLSNTTV